MLFFEQMKNLSHILHLLVIFQLLVSGCDNKSRNQDVRNRLNTIENEWRQAPSSNGNIIDQRTLPPYKNVDSLVGLLDKNFMFSEAKKLDSLCFRSDGDLTEYLGSITISLFNGHLNDFLEYLQVNSNSCLKARLIEVLGAKYSVYEKTERSERLMQEENRLISISKKHKLGDQKIELIRELFAKVDPYAID